MNLKKIKMISVIGIFALCFLLHFVYQWTHAGFIAIIAPVNESIWEHMKLIFTATIIWSIVDYLLINKNNIKVNNIITQIFLSAFLSIPLYLAIFLPIYHKIGENMAINITIMAIVIIITQVLSYYILKAQKLVLEKRYILCHKKKLELPLQAMAILEKELKQIFQKMKIWN